MRRKFIEVSFSPARLDLLEKVNEILEEYAEDNLVLTLRQCYYQLVSRDVIPNNDKEYAKLSKLLTDGRMAGIVDWDSIEDRVRQPRVPYAVSDIANALQDTVDQYRLNRMEGQPNYIEVWVEKDALSNVLSRVTEEFHIPLMVNRGYSSCSAMHDAYNRFKRQYDSERHVILYMGDHDPSGLDMIRDINSRLNTDFNANMEIEVKQIALSLPQIKKYNPPPNPAKITDPRAKWYIEKHGNKSWELDALPPKELDKILRKNILELVNKNVYNNMLETEHFQVEELKNLIDKYK